MSARVGLIGHPVAHSISPRFQQAAFDALGIAAHYEAWDVEPAALPAAIAGLRASGTLGANLTIPHKEAVLPHLDRLDETAAAVGAVNTVVNRSGALEGCNTDVLGVQRALADDGVALAGMRAVVWGAGGSARAVAWALLQGGVGALTVVNRTAARAGRLCEELTPAAGAARLDWCGSGTAAAGEALSRCELVVQCTPLGLRGGGQEERLPFAVEALGGDTLVVDLVANPAETALVRAARASGRRASGGLPVLVHQGAASFELWTGRAPPLAAMFAAAAAAMAEGAG